MPLCLERLCVLSRRVCEKIKSNQKILASIVVAFLVLASAPIKLEAMPKSLDVSSADQKSILELRTDSHMVILPTVSLSKIIPGESLAQREAREKAEAALKAQAEAQAKRDTVSRDARVAVKTYNDPTNFDEIYQRAGDAMGVSPALLKAIHTVETGASGSTYRSNPSGATGPMQFLPSTFKRHGIDGNGDGIADISNVEDAIFSAAAYLKACGYPDLKKALWGYNPSSSYYNKVMKLAISFGL
jgi:membrane-bound lytic murein transglycosylase B